jgi:hypothetical protein
LTRNNIIDDFFFVLLIYDRNINVLLLKQTGGLADHWQTTADAANPDSYFDLLHSFLVNISRGHEPFPG